LFFNGIGLYWCEKGGSVLAQARSVIVVGVNT
jgi:hypothetical protein